MEINKTILSKLSDSEIYNYLLNEISYVYDKYRYLSISSEVIDKIIYDEIALSRDNYKDNDNYKNYLKNRIEARIVAAGSKIFNDGKLACQVISKYISEYFSLPNSYNMARNYLKKISSLFSSFNYIPEPTTVISLVNNNNIFSKMLELVIDNHLDYFKEYSVFQLFNDNNIATLIGIYCMVKNIKTRDESLVEDDSTRVDSLREYFNDIDSVPPITPLEMQELGKKVKQGDEEARNRLTEGNLKLVVSIAKAFYRLNDTIPIQDLINAGNIGLMKAASKFDIDLGFRFSTYATYWIRTEIVREIQNNERSIRIPISMREKINAYNHLKEQLMQQKGTEIGYQEMAEVMRVSMNKAIQYERVQEPIVSLNAYYGDDEDTEMQELICIDDFTADIDARNSVIDTKKLFKESGLNDKEIYVLSLRYGYYDGSPRTLEEIGNIYGVTRERIRQIEAKALYKLRICESTKKLAEYTSNPEEALEILQKFSVVYSESELNQKKTNPLASQIINYNTVKKKVK